jgi:hypothetical protein
VHWLARRRTRPIVSAVVLGERMSDHSKGRGPRGNAERIGRQCASTRTWRPYSAADWAFSGGADYHVMVALMVAETVRPSAIANVALTVTSIRSVRFSSRLPAAVVFRRIARVAALV